MGPSCPICLPVDAAPCPCADWASVGSLGFLCLQTISALKGRVSELRWSVLDQEVQVKRLESEKQELQEQLDLQHR